MPGFDCSYDRLSPPVFVPLELATPLHNLNNNCRKLDDVDSPWHRSV